jgi:hypothetical protein
VQKLSELNFKIPNRKGKQFVVHTNRLKKSHDSAPWKFSTVRHPRKKARKLNAESLDETMHIPSRPIATEREPKPRVAEEVQIQVGQRPQSPEMVETPAEEGNIRRVPDSSVRDPDCGPHILHIPEESCLRHLWHHPLPEVVPGCWCKITHQNKNQRDMEVDATRV